MGREDVLVVFVDSFVSRGQQTLTFRLAFMIRRSLEIQRRLDSFLVPLSVRHAHDFDLPDVLAPAGRPLQRLLARPLQVLREQHLLRRMCEGFRPKGGRRGEYDASSEDAWRENASVIYTVCTARLRYRIASVC